MKRHSSSYSIVLRLRYPDRPGMLGRIASAIGEANGSIGAVDGLGVQQGEITRDIVVNACDAEHCERIVQRVRSIPDVTVLQATDRTFLVHQGGKIEVRLKTPVRDAGRPVDGLHAGRGPRLPRHPRRPGGEFRPDHPAEHGGGGLRRVGRAGAGQHRPQGRLARDGGQVHALQGLRRRGRLPHLPRHAGRGRDRPHLRLSGPDVRRDQPGGHLLAALRGHRGAADRAVGDSRSSTTTSTARRWWCWRRCGTR